MNVKVSDMKYALFLAIQMCLHIELQAQVSNDGKRENRLSLGDTTLNFQQLMAKAKLAGNNDTALADKIFRKAIACAINSHDLYGAGIAWYELGEMYFRHKNHNRSLGAFINAKEYFSKNGYKKEEALTNFKMGRTQYYRGNYKLASGHLQYAMREARELNMKDLEADVLEYMGILYHAMPNPMWQSANLLNKSLNIKRQLKNRNGELRILEKLSDVYYEEKKFDSALLCNSSSIELAEKLGLNYDANLSRLNSVPSLLRQNKNTEVFKRLNLIKTTVLDTGDINISIRYFIQEGNYQLALHDKLNAQKNYDSAMLLAQNSGFPELASLVYHQMADAYYYANDFRKAYQCQMQYNRLLATLYSKENISTFKELEYMFNTNMTEEEVKFLSNQNAIKEVRLQDEKKLRLILMIGSTGFLIAGAIIFFLYQKQRKKGLIIEKQSADLQILMNEIHHRVKNNLQVISSLLDLQSLSIGDKQAAEAIRESRNRVQSMALIHENLYQEADLKEIEMESYIKNLASNLFSSYRVSKDEIFLKTNIDPVSLDVDLVILIGLVLNELISNALKHAFCNKGTGILSIKLQQKTGEIFLEVKDNGKGFPQGLNIYQLETFGYKLVKAFAQKLKARLILLNDDGACVQLHITKFRTNS